MIRTLSTLLLVTGAFCMSDLAQAQETEQQSEASSVNTTETYTVEDFAIYNPLTASDVVKQVPGYTLSTTTNLRGLAANAGNLLINGEVPTTKADSIENILSRIPVSAIEKLELRSAQGTADASTSGRILNIVLSAQSGMAGTWRAGTLYAKDNPVVPFASVSARGSLGQSTTYDLGLAAQGGINGYDGPEYVSDLQTDLPLETRQYDQFGFQRQYSANAGITTLVLGTKMNLRGKIIDNHIRAERDAVIINPAGTQVATAFLVV